jgi:hypothetical protein
MLNIKHGGIKMITLLEWICAKCKSEKKIEGKVGTLPKGWLLIIKSNLESFMLCENCNELCKDE